MTMSGSFEIMRTATPYVLGYHGTTRESAAQILAGGTYVPSVKPFDWLGRGWYVWQDDPIRAQEWAEAKFRGADIAVLEATIDLSACLDLIQRKYLGPLQEFAQLILEGIPGDKVATMRQTELLHDIDCTLIESFCNMWRRPDGSEHFTTVRGCFKEGSPVFDLSPAHAAGAGPRSALQAMDHVQIAVRSSAAIVSCRQL
jgi:hypothetical protein